MTGKIISSRSDIREGILWTYGVFHLNDMICLLHCKGVIIRSILSLLLNLLELTSSNFTTDTEGPNIRPLVYRFISTFIRNKII